MMQDECPRILTTLAAVVLIYLVALRHVANDYHVSRGNLNPERHIFGDVANAYLQRNSWRPHNELFQGRVAGGDFACVSPCILNAI